jgi:hypothetical protein
MKEKKREEKELFELQPPIQFESDQTVLVQCAKKASKHKQIEKLKAKILNPKFIDKKEFTNSQTKAKHTCLKAGFPNLKDNTETESGPTKSGATQAPTKRR